MEASIPPPTLDTDLASHYYQSMPAPIPASPTKRYFVLKDFDHPDHKKWKEGDLVRLKPHEAQVLVAQYIVVPLSTAIKEKLYPPKEKDTVVEKLREAIMGSDTKPVAEKLKAEDKKSKSDDDKKSFLGNPLREAVQKKREEQEAAESDETKPKEGADSADDSAKSKISADKLAKIKAGGK